MLQKQNKQENNDYKENKFSANVVLLEPEIPQNTGNIARTCAALGSTLHLIEPLGFSLENRYLRRAGVDYWHMVAVKRYQNIEHFFEINKEGRFFFLTKKAKQSYHRIDCYGPMYFVFGRESVGLPEQLLNQYPDDCYRIPMRSDSRSLNISNAAAVILYEAFRQNDFPGLIQ